MTEEKIARINELAQKKKQGTITAQELAEQRLLYQEYLGAVRANLRQTLDSVTLESTLSDGETPSEAEPEKGKGE